MNNISNADLMRLYYRLISVLLESIQGVLDACALRLAAPLAVS
ncbi:MAG: hypothetical protein V1766_09035 [Pseudomonadota bacterium]